MDQELAYRVMMGFARDLRITTHMQKILDDRWDVIIEPPDHRPVTLHDRESAAAWYTQLRTQARAAR